MASHKPSLWGVLSETSRIIGANSRHFLALSVLFIFPLSLATTIYPLLFQPASLHSHYRRFLSNVSTPDSELPPAGISQLLISILYTLSAVIFNFCAVSSITYSSFHGFYGRPVEFLPSLKSIVVSFFPLLATKLVTMTIVSLIAFGVAMLMMLPYTALVLLGFNMDYYNSVYFMIFPILMAVLLVGLFIFLAIEWSLTTSIVVVESKWGFSPLKRSSYLVKGMKRVVFSMTSFVVILSGLLSILYSNLKANYAGNANEGCAAGWVVVQVVVYAGLTTVLSLYSFVAETVLFVYCKAMHGESGFKIDEKLGGEYVKLPVDAV